MQVLNGVSLDLFALYREVVSRGGFRVGNGINWKGQVRRCIAFTAGLAHTLCWVVKTSRMGFM